MAAARSRGPDSALSRQLCRVPLRGASVVEDVPGGHRNDVEAGAAKRCGPFRAGKHGMARLWQAHALSRKAGFELAEREVGSAQEIGRPGKAGVVIIAVHREIASGQNGVNHASPFIVM